MTCKLPVAVMLSVMSDPSVFKVTLPLLCKLSKRNADALDTEMSFHEPLFASSNFKTPVNILPALLKSATCESPVSAVKVVVPPMLIEVVGFWVMAVFALVSAALLLRMVVAWKLPPMSTSPRAKALKVFKSKLCADPASVMRRKFTVSCDELNVRSRPKVTRPL